MSILKQTELIREIRRISGIMTEIESSDDESWPIYNSSAASFEKFFFDFIPDQYFKEDQRDGVALKLFLYSELFKPKGSGLVLVEAGGTADRLVKDLGDLIDRSRGIVIAEDPNHRGDNDRADLQKHSVYVADIFSSKTPASLRSWLGPDDEIDVFFEKMEGGIREYPDDPYFLLTILNRYYSLMAENSMMFLQLPSLKKRTLARGLRVNEVITDWSETVSNMKNSIDVRVKFSRDNAISFLSDNKIFIRRHPGSPDKMPGLDII